MSEVPLRVSLDGLTQRLIDTQQVWSFHEELHVTSEVAEGCPGYLDYPFQNKRFALGSLAHFSYL